MLDELLFIDGPELYHVYHKKWHPVYRKAMLERNYYDVFMFDLKGNMVTILINLVPLDMRRGERGGSRGICILPDCTHHRVGLKSQQILMFIACWPDIYEF